MIEKTELAWCAGFFDGEGCTTYHPNEYKGKKNYSITMVVAQCIDKYNHSLNAPLSLVRFNNAVGYGKIVKCLHRGGNRREAYRWQCNGYDCVKVFKLLESYLCNEKKLQFEQMRELCRPIPQTKPNGMYCKRGHLMFGNNIIQIKCASGYYRNCRTCRDMRRRNRRQAGLI